MKKSQLKFLVRKIVSEALDPQSQWVNQTMLIYQTNDQRKAVAELAKVGFKVTSLHPYGGESNTNIILTLDNPKSSLGHFMIDLYPDGKINGKVSLTDFFKGLAHSLQGNLQKEDMTTRSELDSGTMKAVNLEVCDDKDGYNCGSGTPAEMVPSIKNIDEQSEKFAVGDKVRISAGSGIDSDKIVTVVDKNNIKVDGRGIPRNVVGNHYHPVDWKRSVAIQYEDGKFGTMFKNRLTKVNNPSPIGESDISKAKKELLMIERAGMKKQYEKLMEGIFELPIREFDRRTKAIDILKDRSKKIVNEGVEEPFNKHEFPYPQRCPVCGQQGFKHDAKSDKVYCKKGHAWKTDGSVLINMGHGDVGVNYGESVNEVGANKPYRFIYVGEGSGNVYGVSKSNSIEDAWKEFAKIPVRTDAGDVSDAEYDKATINHRDEGYWSIRHEGSDEGGFWIMDIETPNPKVQQEIQQLGLLKHADEHLKDKQKWDDQNPLKEMSTTGGVAGYQTPNAFAKSKEGSPRAIASAKKYGKVVKSISKEE